MASIGSDTVNLASVGDKACTDVRLALAARRAVSTVDLKQGNTASFFNRNADENLNVIRLCEEEKRRVIPPRVTQFGLEVKAASMNVNAALAAVSSHTVHRSKKVEAAQH